MYFLKSYTYVENIPGISVIMNIFIFILCHEVYMYYKKVVNMIDFNDYRPDSFIVYLDFMSLFS